MPTTENQYEEAWCTYLLREQQEVNESMAKLVQDQQKTIDELHQKIDGSDQQPPQTSSKYHSGHLFGPDSAPITWIGTIKDLVPVYVDGKEYKAMIMTEMFVDKLNDVFTSATAGRLAQRQANREVEYCGNLREIQKRDSGLNDTSTGLFTVPELVEMISHSKERLQQLEGFSDQQSILWTTANDYIEIYMRKMLEKHLLRSKRDIKEIIDAVRDSRIAMKKGSPSEAVLVESIKRQMENYESDFGGSESDG